MNIRNIYLCLSMLFCLVLGTACSDDPIVENPSGETFIYSLSITNAGLTGTETVQGTLNEEAKTVDFTIPAESDIEAIKFSGKLSLGASLDQESYDVSSGSAQVTVVNVENRGTYTVNVTLLPATATPLLQKVVVRDANGTEKDGFVSVLDKTVYLKSPESEWVEIVSVSCLPKRTDVVWTGMDGDKIYASNPGKLELNFEGFTDEYRVLFDANPVFGADFINYNMIERANSNMYPDYAGSMVRSADFDGKELLVVSRLGNALLPKVMKKLDFVANTFEENVLDVTGIEGGTYLISAGRLSHGHVYICNLSTGVTAENPLKIYHWSSTEAGVVPEVVVNFDGTSSLGGAQIKKLADGEDTTLGGRLGDNLSVCLDEAGNGYAFLLPQEGATNVLRFTVTGFTTFSDPVLIVSEIAADYYAAFNKVEGSEDEYVFTSARALVMIVNHDVQPLFKLGAEAVPTLGTDARIITYDAERYLIMTTGRRASWSGDPISKFLVYNISDGSNTLIALKNFDELEERVPVFSYELGGTYSNGACAANTGYGVSEDGKLLLMTSATPAGFTIFEFPEKQ